MTDNIQAIDRTGNVSLAAKDVGGVLVERHTLVDETNTAVDLSNGVKVTAVTALGAGGSGIIGWLSQIWDRVNAIATSIAGTLTVAGSVASGAADSGNPVKTGGIVQTGTGPNNANATRTDFSATPTGALMIAASTATGGAGADGQLVTGFASRLTTSMNTNPIPVAVADYVFNGSTFDRNAKPNASSRIASAAASVNATSAKGSAGNVHKAFGKNVNAATVYLKLYNKATAPTVGTDTPVLTVPIKAASEFDVDLRSHYFSTGIAYGFTTVAADNGTTALAAGDILDFTLTYS